MFKVCAQARKNQRRPLSVSITTLTSKTKDDKPWTALLDQRLLNFASNKRQYLKK
jgi:hypothetical protein